MNNATAPSIKVLLLITIGLIMVSASNKLKVSADVIIGIWDAGKSNVEIVKEQNQYKGYAIKENGERYKIPALLEVEFADDIWAGKIYSREKEKYFDVECEIDADKLHLEVNTGWLSKDIEWTLVE